MPELPVITYKPGWSFEWQRTEDNLLLWVHIGPPDAKGVRLDNRCTPRPAVRGVLHLPGAVHPDVVTAAHRRLGGA
jgi:hypothetical protein